MTTEREKGPYRFERVRHRLGEYPRPAQPNTYQPNSLSKTQLSQKGNQRQYWDNVYQQYLKRSKNI